MTPETPTTLSLSTASLRPVEDAEGRKCVGATKTPLVEVEELVPSLISLTLSGDGDGQQLAIEEDAEASKSPLMTVEEIPLSTIPFESVQEHTRYHEDDKAHYCLPNEQVFP